MTKLTVAALQLAFTDDTAANIRAVSRAGARGRGQGRQVVLPPELFEGPYFCRVEDESLFANARPIAEHPSVLAMQQLAAELKIWIPTSFFEADGPHHYNWLAMVGPDGKVAGIYRKSHIPDGPGYEEKFYFRPGNTGFKVWEGPHRSTLGVGVCWDQWYPETARAMMLMGADILFYPTAIGTEPHDPGLDTSRLWRRAMVGHAVSNVVPVVAANRIGTEDGQRFYGHSFICDERGDMLAEFGAEETGVLRRNARPRRRRRSTAPPSASSAIGGPSFTGGFTGWTDLASCAAAPLEHAFEHRRSRGLLARILCCSASNDSSTAARGRRARRLSAPWPNFVADGGSPSARAAAT